jgi:hypothetical protein
MSVHIGNMSICLENMINRITLYQAKLEVQQKIIINTHSRA